jgi:hypothetical protein
MKLLSAFPQWFQAAQGFCAGSRNHWGIENKNHHVRDVTMGEDKFRIRTNPPRINPTVTAMLTLILPPMSLREARVTLRGNILAREHANGTFVG